MNRCKPEDLIQRGIRAKLLPEGTVIPPGYEQEYSLAEALQEELRLPEDKYFELLALEHTLSPIPQVLLESMEIPSQFRSEQEMIVFRREGFAPVEETNAGVLVVVSYPYGATAFDELHGMFGDRVEVVFCTDRTFAAILAKSVTEEDTQFGIDATDENEESYFLGSEDEEEMFPGLYGGSASELLQSEEPVAMPQASSEEHKTSGHIEDLGFLDMLQMMSQSRKTGSMVVHSEQFGDVYLFFDEGQIVHCITEYGSGEDGFYRIVGTTKGRFEIVMQPVEVERTINASTDALILEGLRRMDEENA